MTILEALLAMQQEEMDWQEEAKCRETDPDAFFPDTIYLAREAIRVCQRCPVADQCLQMAIDNEETNGVWGGVDFTNKKNKSESRINEAINLRLQGVSPTAIDAKIRSRSSKNRWSKPDR